MTEILHGKVITSVSYYDGAIASTKQENEVSIFSSKESILKDLIDSLSVISSGETHKLNVEVCVDKQGRYRLIKRWVIE